MPPIGDLSAVVANPEDGPVWHGDEVVGDLNVFIILVIGDVRLGVRLLINDCRLADVLWRLTWAESTHGADGAIRAPTHPMRMCLYVHASVSQGSPEKSGGDMGLLRLLEESLASLSHLLSINSSRVTPVGRLFPPSTSSSSSCGVVDGDHGGLATIPSSCVHLARISIERFVWQETSLEYTPFRRFPCMLQRRPSKASFHTIAYVAKRAQENHLPARCAEDQDEEPCHKHGATIVGRDKRLKSLQNARTIKEFRPNLCGYLLLRGWVASIFRYKQRVTRNAPRI